MFLGAMLPGPMEGSNCRLSIYIGTACSWRSKEYPLGLLKHELEVLSIVHKRHSSSFILKEGKETLTSQ